MGYPPSPAFGAAAVGRQGGGKRHLHLHLQCRVLISAGSCGLLPSPWGSQDSPWALGNTEERGEGSASCPGSQDSGRQADAFPTFLLTLGPTLWSLVLSPGVATIHNSLLPFLSCLSTWISFPKACHSEEHCPQHLRGASELVGYLWAQLVGNTLSPARMEEVPEAGVKEANRDMEGGT